MIFVLLTGAARNLPGAAFLRVIYSARRNSARSFATFAVRYCLKQYAPLQEQTFIIGEIMKRPIFVKPLFVFCVVTALAVGISGQAPLETVEPSYEVSLQLMLGSDSSSAGADVPNNLASILKHLKKTYSFNTYKVAGTFLGRVTNTGSFEYKSTSNIFGREIQKSMTPTFLDWALTNFRTGPTSKSQQGFQARAFRFGARVPVLVSQASELNKANSVVNYESIGLSLREVGLVENTPALIGNLSLPGTEGTLFLVMTIRAADM